MGNNICQRVFSSNSGLLSLWKDSYNEMLGPRVLVNERARTLILSIEDQKDEVILQNIMRSVNDKQDLTASRLHDTLAKIKGVLPASELESPGILRTSNMLRKGTNNTSVHEIEDYKFQIASIIHTWLLSLNKELSQEEELVKSNPFQKLITALGKTDSESLEKQARYINPLMTLTLRLIVSELTLAIQESKSQKIIEYVAEFSTFFNSMGDEELRITSETDLKVRVLIQNLAEALLETLHSNSSLSIPEKKQVLLLVMKINFFVGSLGLHIRTISSLLKLGDKISFARSELPSLIKDYEAKVPIFFADLTMEEELEFENKENSNCRTEEFEDNSLIITNNATKIITENYSYIASFHRAPFFGQLKFIKARFTPRSLYYYEGSLRGVYSDDVAFVNPVTLDTEGPSLYYYCNNDMMHEQSQRHPLLTEEISGQSWSYNLSFKLFTSTPRSTPYVVKFLQNDNYSSEKPISEKNIHYLCCIYKMEIKGSSYYPVEQYPLHFNNKLYLDFNEDRNNLHRFGLYNGLFWIWTKDKMWACNLQTGAILWHGPTEYCGFDCISDQVYLYRSKSKDDKKVGTLITFPIGDSVGVNLAAKLWAKNSGTQNANDNIKSLLGVLKNKDVSEESDSSEENIKPKRQEEVAALIQGDDLTGSVLLLKYVDLLTRKIVATKTESPLNISSDDEKKYLLNPNCSEVNASFFETVSKVMRKGTFTTENEAALIVYVMKSLEKQLERLHYIQNESSTIKILGKSTLKKLARRVERVSIPVVILAESAPYFKRCKEHVLLYISKLIKTNDSFDVIGHICDLLDSDYSITFKECRSRLELLNLTNLNSIKKTKVESTSDIAVVVFDTFSKKMSELLELEFVELLRIVKEENESFNKTILQRNLINFFNALVSQCTKNNFEEQLVCLLNQFLNCSNSFMDNLNINLKQKRSETADFTSERFLESFDVFFSTSLFGTIVTLIASMNEYNPSKAIYTPINHLLRELSMKFIRFVNLLGEELVNYQVKGQGDGQKGEVKKFEIEFETQNNKVVKVEPPKDANYVNISLESGESGIQENKFIYIFKYHPGNQFSESYEFIGFFNNETSHRTIKVDGDSNIFLVSQTLSSETDTVTALVEIIRGSWLSTLNFVNLVKIQLTAIASTIKDEIKQEQNHAFSEEISKNIERIDVVLGSKIFENGINIEVYNSVQEELGDLSNLVLDETLSWTFLQRILDLVHATAEEKLGVINLYRTFQRNVKSLYSNLAGETGFNVVSCLFTVYLIHQRKIEDILVAINNKDMVESFENDQSLLKAWEKCINIRRLVKQFELNQEGVPILQKLLLLVIVEPSSSWVNKNHTKSIDIKSDITEDSNRKESDKWKRVKKVLTKLRNKRGEQMQDNLIELISNFLEIPLDISDLSEILHSRRKLYDSISKGIKFLYLITDDNKGSVLSEEIFLLFESIFRKTPNHLDYLTENYGGLDRTLQVEQSILLKNLMLRFVEFCCNKENPVNTKLQVLQSMKWQYRGRESDFVTEIDVKKIWENNTYSPNLTLSIIELIEVLMNYIFKKTKSEQKQVEAAPSLSLKRHESIIDENNLVNILKSNLEILMQELTSQINALRERETLDLEEYRVLLKSRNFERNPYNYATLLLSKTEVSSDNPSHEIGSASYTFELPEEFSSSSKSELLSLLRTQNEERIEVVNYILTIFYTSLVRLPDIATNFFANPESTEILMVIVSSDLPETLQLIALNIIDQIARHLPLDSCARFAGFVEFAKKNIFTKENKNIATRSIRVLLNSNFNSESGIEVLQYLKDSGRTDLVLDILDGISGLKLVPGQIVERRDISGSPRYIILPNDLHIYKIFSERLDKVECAMHQQKQFSVEFKYGNLFKNIPCLDTTYGSIELFEPVNLRVIAHSFSETLISSVVKRLGLMNTIIDSVPHLCRMIDIAKDYKLLELAPDLRKAVNEALSRHTHATNLYFDYRSEGSSDIEVNGYKELGVRTAESESRFKSLKKRVIRRTAPLDPEAPYRNQVLAKQVWVHKTAARKFDRRVFLCAKNIPIIDQETQNTILLARAVQRLDLLEVSSEVPSHELIINLLKRSTRLEDKSIERDIELRMNIAIDSWHINGKIQEVSTTLLEEFANESDPETSIVKLSLLLKLVKKVSSVAFFKKLWLSFFTKFADTLSRVVDGKINNNAYSVLLLTNLAKNFRDLSSTLFSSKLVLDLTELTEKIELIFTYVRLNDETEVLRYSDAEIPSYTISKVINSMAFSIFRFTSYDKKLLEGSFAILLKRLEVLAFDYEVTQTKTESPEHIISAGSIIYEMRQHRDEEITKSAWTTIKCEFGKSTEANLSEYEYWFMSAEEESDESNLITTISSDKDMREIVCGYSSTSSSAKSFFNHIQCIQMPLVTEERPYYTSLSYSANIVAGGGNAQHFNLISSQTYEAESLSVGESDSIIIADGKLFRMNTRIDKYFMIEEGITLCNSKVFYKGETKQLYLFGDSSSSDSMPGVLSLRSAKCSNNPCLFDISEFPLALDLYDMQNSVALLLEDGSLMIIFRDVDEIQNKSDLVQYLMNAGEEPYYNKETSTNIKQLLFIKHMKFPVNCLEINRQKMFLAMMEPDGCQVLQSVNGAQLVEDIRVGKDLCIKCIVSGDESYSHVFVLMSNGELYWYSGGEAPEIEFINFHFKFTGKSAGKLKQILILELPEAKIEEISRFEDNNAILIRLRSNGSHLIRLYYFNSPNDSLSLLQKTVKSIRLRDKARLPPKCSLSTSVTFNGIENAAVSDKNLVETTDFRELISNNNGFIYDYPLLLELKDNEYTYLTQKELEKKTRGDTNEQKQEVNEEPEESLKTGTLYFIVHERRLHPVRSDLSDSIQNLLDKYVQCLESPASDDLPIFTSGSENILYLNCTYSKDILKESPIPDYVFMPPNASGPADFGLTLVIVNRLPSSFVDYLSSTFFYPEDDSSTPRSNRNALFFPDITRLPKKSFETLCQQQAKPLIHTLIEVEGVTEKLDCYKDLNKSFMKYRDVITSKMKKLKKTSECSKLYQIFYQQCDELEEMYYFLSNLPSTEVRQQYEKIYYGLMWVHFRLFRLMDNFPTDDGLSWESDLSEGMRQNFFDTISISGLDQSLSATVYITVDRMVGLKSNKQHQKASLLNQLYWRYLEDRRFNAYCYRFNEGFQFKFKGEPGIDVGGLRRDYIKNLVEEVLQRLDLFVPTPNSKHGIAEERDKFIANPRARTSVDLFNFYKLGFVMGTVLIGGDIVPLSLPSIFWRFLVTGKVDWEDVKSIDKSVHGCLKAIEDMNEIELEQFDVNFILPLDDEEIELKPNGKKIILTKSNKAEYINLFKKTYFEQFMPAFEEMRRGFFTSVHRGFLLMVTPQSLEKIVCGVDYVDINILKQISRYQYFPSKKDVPEHPAVKRFWRVLESFSQEQLGGYLQYVWGRRRLTDGSADIHKISFHPSKTGIPEAHTCFFEIDIGEYPSDEDLRAKLIYGIENCYEIAEGNRDYDLNADFGE